MATGRFVPKNAVDRPLLLKELDSALDRTLTLLVAQAGAGKSVITSQWVATLDREVVWIDIVEADNDPVHFMAHVLDAVRGLQAESPNVADHLTAGPGLGAPFVDALTAALATAPPAVIVVDDLHHLHNNALLNDILRVRMPETLSVVVLTRTDPPIARSRGLLRGDIGELRQSDLALDHAQSGQLIETIADIRLDESTLAALVERTEGWAAGLHLAAMALRHHTDPEAFVARFSGSDRLVSNYLSEQVVRALPENRRDLLLTSAVVDRISGELLDYIADDPHAHESLRELEQNSMFLIPVDAERDWFRFHQLVRDLLRHQLHAIDPSAESRSLKRAADWHVQRGELDPAIDYSLRACDWERAADLILARGADVFERGEIAGVVTRITTIPEASRAANIDLTLLLGILQALRGDAEVAEDTLNRAAGDPTATAGQHACAATFLAALAQWRADPQSSIAWANRAVIALAAHPHGPFPDLITLTGPQSLETIATISGGRAHFLAANLVKAREWLERGLASQGAAYSIWRISGLGSLALLEAWIGHMREAEVLATQALALAVKVTAESHPSTAEAHLALALAAAHRGRDADASRSLGDGWRRVEANGRSQLAWVFYAAARSMNLAFPYSTPPGAAPPAAAERLATAERAESLAHGWVAAHSESPAASNPTGLPLPQRMQLVEPLTERELEVLAFLPTRITTNELAQRFYVSVNTIKTHLAHIYRKLGVVNRTDAITRATEVGLLRW